MNIEFAHANGFSFSTYRSFISLLSPHNVRGVDKFAHGNYPHTKNWQPLVSELIASIQTHHTSPVVGIGHSLGGVLTFWAAHRRPDLFRQIILLDPPMFAPNKRIPLWIANLFGASGKVVPPAIKTKNRRTDFASREEARDYFRQRALFRNFHEDSLTDYVTYGLKDTERGVTLDFSREIEYRLFCQTPTRLGPKNPPIPSFFVYSTEYQVLSKTDVSWLKRNLKATRFIPFQAGHMFPLEEPQKTADLLNELMCSL